MTGVRRIAEAFLLGAACVPLLFSCAGREAVRPISPAGAAGAADFAGGSDASGGSVHTVFPGTPLGENARAAMEDAKSGDPAKIRALLPYFATEDNERLVRFVATLDARAVGPLLSALDDPDPGIAETAAGLLGELRAREAVPKLTDYLTSGRPRRYAAAWALGEIKDPGSIPVLIASPSDGNPGVVKASTRARRMMRPTGRPDSASL